MFITKALATLSTPSLVECFKAPHLDHNCLYYKLYINDITNVSYIIFAMPLFDDSNVFIYS